MYEQTSVELPDAPIASGLFSLARKPTITDDRWVAGYEYLPILPGKTIHNRSAVNGGPGTVGENQGTGIDATVIQTNPWLLEVEAQISMFSVNDPQFRAQLAKDILDFHTSTLLERELWTGEIAQAAGLPNRYLADPDLIAEPILGGTDGLSAQDAVATIVGRLSQAGMGQVMVHVPKRIGIMLPDGWKNAETLKEQGFVVVSGVGYPDEGVIYGTEICNVRVSELEYLGDPQRDNINTSNNQATYTAQRFGAVDFAGPVFACRVTG